MDRRLVLSALLVASTLLSSRALAQQPTFAEGRGAAASTDDIDLNLTAGGTLSYGNARSLGLNVGAKLTIAEGSELFVAEVTYVFGIAETPATCADVRANPARFPVETQTYCGAAMGGMADGARAPGFTDWKENSSNLNWRLRWDHFFDPENAFFAAHRGRVDYFAGLDVRLGLQLGYSRMLFREGDTHTLALDVGIDTTVDVYSAPVREQNRAIIARGESLPNLAYVDARFVPAIRLQLAYTNHVNAVFTYDTTFEMLWDVPNPDHFRFEWVNHFRSAIADFLQLSVDVTFRLDSLPPGQARAWQERSALQTTTMFDVLTTVNLVGNFDLDGEPPAAPEEPECPEPTPCPECPPVAAEPPADAPPAEPVEAPPAEAAAETPPAEAPPVQP